MKKLVMLIAVCFAIVSYAFPAVAESKKQLSRPSILVESEGEACLGTDKTRSQVIKLALDKAKRLASEQASTHVSRETSLIKGKLETDFIDVYSRATVKILKELEKGWVKSAKQTGYVDECYRIKIRAEIFPADVDFNSISGRKIISDPRLPLTVELWTDKASYNLGDELKFYFRGNKPFYAKAVYKDAEENLIEVTPSHKSKYYKGGVVYEIPSNKDKFTLLITPPFGNEKLILYTSTAPMSRYDGQQSGELYLIRGGADDLGTTTRGLTILQNSKSGKNSARAEFAETEAKVKVLSIKKDKDTFKIRGIQ